MGLPTPFFKLLQRLADEGWLRRLKPRQLRILFALLRFRNAETGLAWPSLETLSKLTGVNKSDLCRALKKLAKKGLVVIVKKGGGKSKSTVRLIDMPDQSAGAARTKSESSNRNSAHSTARTVRAAPSSQSVNHRDTVRDSRTRTEKNRKRKSNNRALEFCDPGVSQGESAAEEYFGEIGIDAKLVKKFTATHGPALAEKIADFLEQNQDADWIHSVTKLGAHYLRHPDKFEEMLAKKKPRHKREEDADDSHLLDEVSLPGGASYGEMLRRSAARRNGNGEVKRNKD
jgi:Helix-turn-helix domain